MQDESLAVVRDRYLGSTRKDQGTGNDARDAEGILTNWLAWCLAREPPVTSTGDLEVTVLGEWARSLKRRTHAAEVGGTTTHTYYAIVGACLSWAGKCEDLGVTRR